MCSVALGKDGQCLQSLNINDGYSHAEKLAPFAAEVLSNNGIKAGDLDAVSISKGPGSYTGLRIGVSLAKGVCFAAQKPLIAVETLQLMCLHSSVRTQVNFYKDTLLCPMLDARRMEVYTALFDVGLKFISPVEALILEEHRFESWLDKELILFFGPGADKFKGIMKNPSAHFIDDVWPQAENMVGLSELRFADGKFENLAYFEPYYLKEFMSTSKPIDKTQS